MHHHHRVQLAEGAVHREACCAPGRPDDGLNPELTGSGGKLWDLMGLGGIGRNFTGRSKRSHSAHPVC